jgi:formate--tetrahydrofolate ligase
VSMKNDIDIARDAKLKHISVIAQSLGIKNEHFEQFGSYKAKIDPKAIENIKPEGKLVLVTAISPTPAGEGKTTTTIGLTDALRLLDKKAVLALREPSLGPVFGLKGGAAGGGYAQVVPMEDINLHFTGDIHAVGSANNLLASMIDNHIYHGNRLGIDPKRITWKRCLDMNDRQLRFIVDGLGGRVNGNPREDGFDITVASEVMAIVCLASDMEDLKERLSRIVIGYTYDEKPISAGDLNAHGAMAALLKDTIKPNLVQTLEGAPALVHGGPFANIAHGCSSVTASRLGVGLAEYCITEAGFGADLGAEKFIDIKCRMSGLKPSAVVIVATIRALKYHGGIGKNELDQENLKALNDGMPNLLRHVNNMKKVFGLPCVVALNEFPTDTGKEIDLFKSKCKEYDIDAAVSQVWSKGGGGAKELAEKVIQLCETKGDLKQCYSLEDSIEDKIDTIVKRIYHGEASMLTAEAKKQAKQLEALGFGHLPICMAKTQYSFSDNPLLAGAPEHFTITVKSLKLSAGAGFIVAFTGDMMTMPGLPKIPAAEGISVDEKGEIIGLF